MSNALPTVVIIGRPNVGKSTLFNRLIKRQKAIVHDLPGVTRDRIFGFVSYASTPFNLVDTGGLVLDDPQGLENDIAFQTMEALEVADIALLVVDGREGLTSEDLRAVELIRKANKKTILAVNKIDGDEQESAATHDFHRTGFEPIGISAAHGHGIKRLIEEIEKLLPEPVATETQPDEENVPVLKIAFIGRPNAGKSSMLNAILGENRFIVSPYAGTTRDSVDVNVDYGNKKFTFVDTAGVRRRTKINDSLERFSVLKALQSANRADVSVLVTDAQAGIVAQDKKLLAYLDREKKPFIIAVNKADLIPRKEDKKIKEDIKEELRMCPNAPIVYTSALTGSGLGGLLPLAERLKQESEIRITTGKLNQAMKDVLGGHQPPLVGNRRAKFYYMTQAETSPPTFVMFVNDTELVKKSYAKYLENRLRKLFNISMAPMQIVFKSSHTKKE